MDKKITSPCSPSQTEEIRKKRIKVSLRLAAFFISVQLARILVKQLAFSVFGTGLFVDRAASASFMIVFSVFFWIWLCKRRIGRFFAQKRVWLYWIFSSIWLFALVSGPLIMRDTSPASLLSTFYAGAVVPLFEELLFRRYAYELLGEVFGKWGTYFMSAVFFSAWHLMYFDSLSIFAHGSLLIPLLTKAAVGLFFSLILGLIIMKTKNTLSTFLAHAIMNIFAP